MSFESLLADPSLLVYHPLQDNAASTAISNPAAGGSDGELLGGSTTAARSVDEGPAEWLPRSIHLSYSPHHVRIGSPSPESIDAFTVLFRVRPDSVSGARDFAGRWDSYTTTPTADNQRFLIRTNGAQSQFFVRRATASTTASAAGPNLAADVWHNIAAVATGSVLRIGVNGVFGSDASLSGPYLPSPSMDWFIGAAHSGSSSGRYADFAIFTRALSSAEIADWFAGPTGSVPENLSPPTLTIYSTSFTGSVGSWDAMGAGPLTYEWELRDGGDNVVDSGAGTTISGTGSFSGQYYLWVQATNSIGSEEAASSLVEAGEPEPIQAELPDVEVPLKVESATLTTEFDATPASIAAAIQVEIATPITSFVANLHDIAIIPEVESVTTSAGQLATLGIVSQSIEAEAMAATTAYTATLHDIELPLAVEHAEPSFAEIPQTSLSDSALAVEVEQMTPAVSYTASLYDISLPIEVFSGEASQPTTGNVFGLKTSSGYFFLKV